MDGLPLKTEQDLRIYCVTETVDGVQAERGRFLLAYSIDEVQNAVVAKWVGRNILFQINGDIPVERIMEQVEKRTQLVAMPAEGALTAPVHAGDVIPQSAEQKREQFMRNLMLFADRFAEGEDAVTIRGIVERSMQKTEVKT